VKIAGEICPNQANMALAHGSMNYTHPHFRRAANDNNLVHAEASSGKQAKLVKNPLSRQIKNILGDKCGSGIRPGGPHHFGKFAL
jgi:hypothetical protein